MTLPPLAPWALTGVPHRLDDGLINTTFRVEDGNTAWILQRLNTDIFVPEVHEDIEAVTRHLAQHGLETPRLCRTRSDTLWHTDETGVWRLFTHHGDRTIHKVHVPAEAASAGALIGQFHTAVSDLDWSFRSVRPGAHDTPGHFQKLRQSVERRTAHRLYDEVKALAEQLEEMWGRWEGPTDLPRRVIHGDLKISNIRFTGPAACCLVDLDTLAYGTLDVELGDALRSWCNRANEDSEEAVLDTSIFEAALVGWSQTGTATAAEWESIVPGLLRICIELAARFAWDALEECYFGWDPARGRGEHNLLRARGQADLATRVAANRGALDACVARIRSNRIR